MNFDIWYNNYDEKTKETYPKIENVKKDIRFGKMLYDSFCYLLNNYNNEDKKDIDNFLNRLPEYIHYFPIKMRRGISLSGVSALYNMIHIFKKEKG